MKAHKIIGRLRANGNELKELISLSSFIDQKDANTVNQSVTADDFMDTIFYNELSKIELRIGLFVASKDGVPLDRSKATINEFRKAASEVIFKGFDTPQIGSLDIDLHAKNKKGKRIVLSFNSKGVLGYVNYINIDDQEFSIARLQSLFGGIKFR